MTHPREVTGSKEQIQTLPTLMETFLQDFERKLYITGGELSLEKTCWYMIAWIRKDTGEARIATIEEPPREIHLTSGKGQKGTKIKRYERNMTKGTLGARIAPTRTMDKKLEHRAEHCNRWAHAMLQSNLTRRGAYKAYHNVLIPRISFPLTTITMIEKDLKEMQVKVDKVYLPRVGLSRHFPLEVLNRPSDYWGLEHKTFNDRQGITKIKLPIGSIRKDVDISKLIQASLELTQLEPGLETPIMKKHQETLWQLDRTHR